MKSILLQELKELRPKLAEAAQKIYDQWNQDSEGVDETSGTGGICDEISEAIGSVIAQKVAGAELFSGGQEGDDHAFIVVQRDDEAFGVDIPPGVYESGGGYNWRKKEGVTFSPEYVVIFPVPMQEE